MNTKKLKLSRKILVEKERDIFADNKNTHKKTVWKISHPDFYAYFDMNGKYYDGLLNPNDIDDKRIINQLTGWLIDQPEFES